MGRNICVGKLGSLKLVALVGMNKNYIISTVSSCHMNMVIAW